jgi:hypothetical protein
LEHDRSKQTIARKNASLIEAVVSTAGEKVAHWVLEELRLNQQTTLAEIARAKLPFDESGSTWKQRPNREGFTPARRNQP